MRNETVQIIVSGKVQGVFFRQSTREKARELGLTGKVMNMEDDTVHIVATGSKEKLEILIEWCRTGPPKARVTGVETKNLPLQDFDRFDIDR